MGLFGGGYKEEEILEGEKAFRAFWIYCKPIISNVFCKLNNSDRLQALENFTFLNDECNRHFGMSLREVLVIYLGLLERKSMDFAPGHFNVIDGSCRALGLDHKIEFYTKNMELQINVISKKTNCSPIMIQLVHDSPLLSIYFRENGVEKSLPIDGSSV